MRCVKTRSRGKSRVGLHPKPRDQLNGSPDVVQVYDRTHWQAVAPICSTEGVHPPDWVRSQPLPSWKVRLRDDVEPLDVCKIEQECCTKVPYGVENHADLADKKPYSLLSTTVQIDESRTTYRLNLGVAEAVLWWRPVQKVQYHTVRWAIPYMAGRRTTSGVRQHQGRVGCASVLELSATLEPLQRVHQHST